MSSAPIEVVYTERAAREVEAAHAWWQANRPEARNAIIDELHRAVELLVLQPAAGALASLPRLKGVRRVLLPRVGYFVYYRFRSAHRQVEMLALWHARRGTAPLP